MATVKTAAEPQPPMQLVQIGNARRERQLRELRLKLDRGQAEVTRRSMQARLNGFADPSGSVAMCQLANEETERVIAELVELNERDLVLRFVPEAPAAGWATRQPPQT